MGSGADEGCELPCIGADEGKGQELNWDDGGCGGTSDTNDGDGGDGRDNDGCSDIITIDRGATTAKNPEVLHNPTN